MLAGVRLLLTATSTLARASAAPNGVLALKMSLARPSHKFRRLKAALMTVGALRDVTCRTFSPPSVKDPWWSPVPPRAVVSESDKALQTMPTEPTTSRGRTSLRTRVIRIREPVERKVTSVNVVFG